MLDLKLIRERKELVAANNANRKVSVDLDALLALDAEKIKLQQKIDELRAERNKRSKIKPGEEEIKLMKKIGEEIAGLEALADDKEAELKKLLYQIPNLTHPDVPVGKDETENKVLRIVGEPTHFSFPPQEHWQLGEKLGVLDFKTAAVVSGSRFTYLKGKLVLLEFALLQYALAVVTDEGILASIIAEHKLSAPPRPFIPVIPPVLIKPEIMEKMARLEPRDERYHITNDDLYLVGSAEHTLGALHLNQTVPESDLPLRYVGFSASFRREAGSYGKDTKGMLRTHQFDKLELESFTAPDQSLAEQDFIVAIQEYIMRSLELPYRVVINCTGDTGLPDYRQIDIETWLPGQNKYRETHSSDYNTDYQARRLNSRFKVASGETEFLHMNDATLVAFSRLPVAIMENYQQADGHIKVPAVLRPYLNFDRI